MPTGKVRTVRLNVVAKYLYLGMEWILTDKGEVYKLNGNKISMHPSHSGQADRVQYHGKKIWSAMDEAKDVET
jgi:hypothetical protein